LALKFYDRFQKEHGSVFCRDLVGYDLTDPKELKKAWDSNVFISKCLHFVEKAVEILVDLSESAYVLILKESYFRPQIDNEDNTKR